MLNGKIAELLRGSGDKPWDEFGTTTGRPRRVGWLDLPMLRYTKRVNSLTSLVLTKLDILSGLPELKVCDSYQRAGAARNVWPGATEDLAKFSPVYESLPVWDEDLTACVHFNDLPKNAQYYVQYIEDKIDLPISYISVGPGRAQIIKRDS